MTPDPHPVLAEVTELFDAAVLLGVCDKIVPGLAMGRCRSVTCPCCSPRRAR